MAIQDYLSGITRATAGQTQDVSNAAKDLANLQAGAGSLPSKLKEALNTKLNNNRDLINQQAETMQNYFNAGPQAREKYQNIWDPFKKAALVQGERSAALRPYDVLTGVLENRMGQVGDIVESGVQGWQGMVNAAGTKAELAKTNLASALQAYLAATDMQQAADQLAMQKAQQEESKRQFGITSAQEQQKINNQMSQFEKELELKKRLAAVDGSKAAKDKAELTDKIWQSISKDADGNFRTPEQVWQAIHNSEATWGAMGVDMNTLWDGYKAMGGGSSAPVTTPAPTTGGKGILDYLRGSPQSTLPQGAKVNYVNAGVDYFGNPIKKKIVDYPDPFKQTYFLNR